MWFSKVDEEKPEVPERRRTFPEGTFLCQTVAAGNFEDHLWTAYGESEEATKSKKREFPYQVRSCVRCCKIEHVVISYGSRS